MPCLLGGDARDARSSTISPVFSPFALASFFFFLFSFSFFLSFFLSLNGPFFTPFSGMYFSALTACGTKSSSLIPGALKD